jgi:hypothetical protein
LPTDGEDGAKHRTGSISVSLAGSDGRVFGGGVAGMLMAASPIQVCCAFSLSQAKPCKGHVVVDKLSLVSVLLAAGSWKLSPGTIKARH